MELRKRLDEHIKSAMLSGDKERVSILRGLKSAILYSEVESGKRESGLSDQEMVKLLRGEIKKRKESAEMYVQGGAQNKADKELNEIDVINAFLPEEISDEDLDNLIKKITEVIDPIQSNTGRIIGEINKQASGAVDGSRVAAAIKRLAQ